jgi:hypothetical protein
LLNLASWGSWSKSNVSWAVPWKMWLCLVVRNATTARRALSHRTKAPSLTPATIQLLIDLISHRIATQTFSYGSSYNTGPQGNKQKLMSLVALTVTDRTDRLIFKQVVIRKTGI